MNLLDNTLNHDDIGEKEILVVSFGTSFNESRAEDIKGIEDAFRRNYPSWSIRRAFTSQMIIDHIKRRDHDKIDNVTEALERAVRNGVRQLIIQPTHLMQGEEYDKLLRYVEKYQDQFESVKTAHPLLGEVGKDATISNEDKEKVAKIIIEEILKDSGYLTVSEAEEDRTAFVLLGHGTWHDAKVSYTQMQQQMENLGFSNVFIGTVEGDPEDTKCEAVLKKIEKQGYKNVVFRPLMVVAGDHANNDMAGEDEDSWVNVFKRSGAFTKLETQIKGLGRIQKIQEIYIAHTKVLMDEK